MLLQNVENIVPGMKLGESLYGRSGQLLLRSGVSLNSKYISSLRDMGYPAIYVKDDDTSDIDVPQPVTPATRVKVLSALAGAFQAVSTRIDSFRNTSQDLLLEHLKSDRFAKAVASVGQDADFVQLFKGMDSMVDQLMNRDVLIGLNSIKTHDDYTFQHSIDVTIMGIVLAKRAGWSETRIRTFGIGCLLHDIGKIIVDGALLKKSGALSREEFELVKMHPIVGRDLIRAIAPGLGCLVPQVAYQHHEREDGSGYPRGLKGDNVLGSRKSGRIHEFGSLSAVADVYDALTSSRSYRKAWAPDRAVQFICDAAGIQFNREAVHIFTSAVAPFPLCSSVRVLNDRYCGYVGIVSEVREKDLQRPRIRLLFNPFGKRINPIEIDLQADRDLSIISIPPGESHQSTHLGRHLPPSGGRDAFLRENPLPGRLKTPILPIAAHCGAPSLNSDPKACNFPRIEESHFVPSSAG